MMGHQYANCSFCGGEVKERLVSVDYRTNNKLIVIENVPAGVCKQCNEQYYTAKVAKAMEKIALQPELPLKVLSVPVHRFNEKLA
jgi:YgiT-type zinc finger domain-containing protein